MASLRFVSPQDQSMILDWRNSEAVAPYMLRDTPISTEEHQNWFGQVLLDSDFAVFRIMEHEGVDCGLVSISNIDNQERSADWGGYLAPDAPRGSGLGKALMYLSVEVAFNQLNLNRILVEVIVDNSAAIGLYESIGFIPVQTIVNRTEQKRGFVDVVQMSLDQHNWNLRRGAVKKQLVENILLADN
jgi:UDP-4-amino-4,6-dideoxy-N-acetyl-beta-L-altrosamine N-acetyltransferase